MLRIRDVYPGFWIMIFSVPDPTKPKQRRGKKMLLYYHVLTKIKIKNNYIFLKVQKNFSELWVGDLGRQIRDPRSGKN